MGVQKTFTVIPPAGPATRTPVDNRPMTSKQVRKAYQAANRVPRLSKAERIKQERAEQERIRKEFEKEKAAARAKFLREKKKAKEQAEKEEKKKKGLPLVTVRPSQDTIAKFFRGNGLGHKRSCEGEDVGEAADTAKASELPVVEELVEDDDEEEDDFPSPKRLCNETEQDGKVGEGVERRERHASPLPEEPCAESRVVAEEKQNGLIIEDDFFDGFEIMSDEEMSKLSFNETATHIGVDNRKEDAAPQSPVELDAMPVEKEKSHLHDRATSRQSSPIKSTKNPKTGDSQEFDLIFGTSQSPVELDATPVEKQKSHPQDKAENHQVSPAKSIKNPELGDSQEFDLIFGDQEDLELEMLALDAIPTFQQTPTKESIEMPLPRSPQKSRRKTTAHELDLGLAADSDPDKQTHRAKSQKEHDQTSLMPPPPIPSAPRPSVSPISPVAAEPQAPPLSTQQILFNMDDFFPSPSQQAAELEEEEVTFTSPIKSRLESKVQTPNPPRVSQKGPFSLGSLSSSSPDTPKPFFTASGSNERMAVALLRSRRTAEQEEERRRQTMQLELAEIEKTRKKEAERRARDEMLAAGKLNPKHANHTAARTGRDGAQISNPASSALARISQFSTRKRLIMNDNRTPVKPTPQRRPLIETNPKATTPGTKSPIVANMSRKVTSLGSNFRPSPSSFTPHNTNRMVQEARQQYSSPKHANTPIIPANKPKDANTSLDTSESKCPPASQESEFGGSWMDELATELSL
ncbi:hypothetical protein TRIATDRAFT_90008 [Trichoderma atroviride IMI 206040]|uniref:Uncharacterized protein n=1 Tax=Hypocrea atroviridis (strain ATCC 20476 / IMI 206040) TaxID=452589 RepID=G9NRL9_HYPAI|nr:uncharacterized protein TRIATDRAFT_90008 [Trichoderma atroviride IMI 206040]EHK46652.1 hypothetical protein TRIATDRAFT_90008 [Trichoderma atroviride IMI 206040]